MVRKTKRLTTVIVLVMMFLGVLVLPAFAGFSDIADKNRDVIFKNTDLTKEQEDNIISYFDNMPQDASSWNQGTVVNTLFLDQFIGSNQTTQMAANILNNKTMFVSTGNKEDSNSTGKENTQLPGSVTRDEKDTPGTNNRRSSEEKATERDQGGTFERIVAGIVEVPCTVIERLLEKGGFKSLDELIFMEKDGQKLTDAEKQNLPWEGKEPEYIRKWFYALLIATSPFYLIAVVVTAFKFFYSANNPDARAEAVESIQRWFLSIGIVALAPILVSTIMLISGLAVDAITAAFQAVASGMGRSVSDWGQFGAQGIVTGSVLGTVMVRLFLLLMFAYLNCLYIIRKLALTVFYVFTPIAALLWAINKKTTAMVIWLGEIASNAFMPVAHVLVLCTVLLLCDVKDMGGSWLTILIMLYTVVPTAEAIRNSFQSLFARWAGVNEQSTARGVMGAAMGFGGIMSMGRLAKASFGGSANAAGRSLKVKPPSKQTSAAVTASANPMKQIGFRPGEPTNLDYKTQPMGLWNPEQNTGQVETTIGDRIPSSRGSGLKSGYSYKIPNQQQPVSERGNNKLPPSRYQKAVQFGTSAGKAVSTVTAATLGAVAGAVPGGTLMAYPAARAAGAATRVAATAAHMATPAPVRKATQQLAGGVSNARQRIVQSAASAVSSSPVAKGVRQAKQMGQEMLKSPKVHQIVETGKAASLAVKTGINPAKAMRTARYMDAKAAGLCKLDTARQR